MSLYTNDIDTLRQMISQSMPQLLTSAHHHRVSVLFQHVVLSVPLTVVTLVMVGADAVLVTKILPPTLPSTLSPSSVILAR